MAKRSRPSSTRWDRTPDKSPECLPRVLMLTAHACMRSYGARFAREVQNNSLPHDLWPRSASRSLWTTLMIPCVPESSSPLLSRSRVLRNQNKRSVGGLGTAMMTLNHQTREKLSVAREKLQMTALKNQIAHRDIDFLWWMHKIRIN